MNTVLAVVFLSSIMMRLLVCMPEYFNSWMDGGVAYGKKINQPTTEIMSHAHSLMRAHTHAQTIHTPHAYRQIQQQTIPLC